MRSFVALLAVVLVPCQANAIDFVVEPRQVSVDDSVRVTLTLDGDLAKLDAVDLPLTNLEQAGPPSVSSQFSLVNGVMSRKKTFSWWVSPRSPGAAVVGPLDLATGDGGVVLVPSVTITVLPAAGAGASTPDEALDRLYLSGRDEVVLVAEADPREAIVGQEVIVTWTLYSAVSLRGFAVSSIPELESFWVEEDLVDERTPRSARIGGHEVQRVAVRRASLFPLRDGELEIPPLEVRIEVIRPLRDPFGGFGVVEGRVAEVRRRSAPITVNVAPKPATSDAVGRFTMRRSDPAVSPDGLVSFEVTVEGTGSLRSMPAPRLAGEVKGEVEVQDAGSSVIERAPMRMRRAWRYVIFPRASGTLAIPSLETTVLVPGEASSRVLRTAPASVDVTMSNGGVEAARTAPPAGRGISTGAAAAGGALVIAVIATLVVAGMRRRAPAKELRRIVGAAANTNTLRKRLDEAVTSRGRDPVRLYGESSELGDAWRSAMSLVDRLENEPESIDEPEREVRARASRLLEDLVAAEADRR